MREIRLKASSDEDFGGVLLGEDSYDTLVTGEDVDVYKPDGSVLLKYRVGVIPRGVSRAAYQNLRDAASPTNNRGVAGGKIDRNRIAPSYRDRELVISADGFNYSPVLINGKKSKTTYSNEVNSGIVGYFDRYPRIPYCRQTAYSLKHSEKFRAAVPFFQEVSRVYEKEMPKAFERQKKIYDETSSDFKIPGSVYTTVTVNKNWQTAAHTDKGDYPEGFGCLAAFSLGKYRGAYLCFPAFRVAVDLQTSDVLLADVHEFHGNTPFKVSGPYERLSLVLYYREMMKDCGSAAYELERAKKNGAKIRAETDLCGE